MFQTSGELGGLRYVPNVSVVVVNEVLDERVRQDADDYGDGPESHEMAI
jgi:hypothetical protein